MNDTIAWIKKLAAEESKKDNKEEKKDKEDKKDKKEKSVPKTSYEKAREKEKGERQKGKKSNPFRVLMGIVGKLLDHGWSKQDIIRHITRHTKFEKETAKNAVKIIQDLQKKKNAFSMNKFSYVDLDETYGTYSVKQEWQKKSTRELILRLSYLIGCEKFDPKSDNGIKHAESSIDGEVGIVVAALKDRGYTDDDVQHLKEGIKKNVYHPIKNNMEEED